MLRKILMCIVVVFLIGVAQAYGDSSIHRWGTELDDWREEGASAVTDSPVYAKGVRISAWSYGKEDDYSFAIADAEYRFSVPHWAGSMDVIVAYSGNDGEWDSGPAGRLWIKCAGSAEGDSFELPEGERSQSVRLAVQEYDDNGWMTLRIVAEGSQEIDVNYVRVHFYTSVHQVRIVTRYYVKYVWRPWYYYTYWRFYPGRHLCWDPYLGCWVRYIYPRYTHYWAPISSRYNAYLRGYYNGRHNERHRWRPRTGGRGHIGRWSDDHTRVRKAYVDSVDSRRGRARVAVPRERVRSVLSQHKRTKAPSKPEIRRGDASNLKQRREAADRWQRSRAQESADRAPSRSGVRTGSTKTRSSSVIRKDTFTRQRQAPVDVRRGPATTDTTRSGSGSVKIRREAVRTVESRSASRSPAVREVRSTPTRSSSPGPSVKVRRKSVRREAQPVRQAPSREVKDDDDEGQKRRAAARRSASSAGGSSRKRRR